MRRSRSVSHVQRMLRRPPVVFQQWGVLIMLRG
jgi:hypothetical protein